MGISTLNNVITGALISRIASGGGSSQPKLGLGQESDEPLSVTLQRGARGAAASIQSLNAGITYINIASDYTNKMLDVVDALDALVKKAGKGNIPPSNAKLYRNQFNDISKAYKALVAGSVVKGRDVLGVDDMSAVLKGGGLDPDKVDELEAAFNKISSFSGVEVSITGESRSNAELFPAENFYRAIRQATRDPEDPPQNDDGSAAFSSIKVAVKEIRDKVTQNIKSLGVAAGLVQKNIELVRAAGFAFLDASKDVTGAQDADSIALQLRGAIRSAAAGSMSEAHNLNSILSAGLLAISRRDSSG